MNRLGVSLKLVFVSAIVACALAGTAASAMAVSIEPLNTKFEGTTHEVTWTSPDIGTWTCAKANEASTIQGTTAATKTNVVEVTPAFLGCTAVFPGGTYAVTYSNSCELPKEMPWKITLNAGGTASMKTNFCDLISHWFSGLCSITITQNQTVSNMKWANEGASNMAISFNTEFPKTFHTAGCESALIGPAEPITLKTSFLIKGIQVH